MKEGLRLNVAISRSRDHFILVCDLSALNPSDRHQMILSAIVANLLACSPQSPIYLLFQFDIIIALQGLRQFDKCAILETPQANRYSATLDDEYHEDEINLRCGLALCFVGDMPQQQANAGSKSKLSS